MYRLDNFFQQQKVGLPFSLDYFALSLCATPLVDTWPPSLLNKIKPLQVLTHFVYLIKDSHSLHCYTVMSIWQITEENALQNTKQRKTQYRLK